MIYQSTIKNSSSNAPEQKIAADPKNATYIIEGEEIALVNGKSEKEIAPGSASKIITQYFGNEVKNDFNGDGAEDVAFLLTQNSGGSGTFYYVAVVLGTGNNYGGYEGTNAVFLGDRIAPQTTEFQNGEIIVNYADRKTSEPMSTSPSIGITRVFSVESSVLNEITSESAKKEQACLIAGGTIGTELCCKSSGDFPNSCLIGACGCSAENSHEVKFCNCGIDSCFDGSKCIGTGEQDITFCQPSQRQGDACFQIYDPVCAKVNIQCIKAPCDPVYQTFSNACEACRNSLVESYTKDECVNIE